MPIDEHDAHRLTIEFVNSDFYKEVFRDFLDDQLMICDAKIDNETEPWFRYGWCDHRKAFRLVDEFIKGWVDWKPPNHDESESIGYGG